VLAAARGQSNEDISLALGAKRQMISRWRRRYLDHRVQGISVVNKSLGRRPVQRKRYAQRILDATSQETPPNGRRWTCRSLARHLGISVSLVQRVWKLAGVSLLDRQRDSHASAPFRPEDHIRLLGCYFQSGQRAIVVEVLPQRKPHQPATASSVGSVQPTIISALQLPLGAHELSPAGQQRLLADQQIDFLRKVERLSGAECGLRLITDGPHSFCHARVRRWLSRLARFSVHYSTSSRLYLVDAEANFRALANQRFLRSLTSDLSFLAESRDTEHIHPNLEMELGFSSLVGGVSTFAGSPIG
jgi:hypothetical protein